jgi:hypothetical protein
VAKARPAGALPKRLTAKWLSQEMLTHLSDALRADGFSLDAACSYVLRRKGDVELRIIPVISASKSGGCRVEVYLHIHVDSIDRLWRPHAGDEYAERFGLSAYAVYFGGIAPTGVSSFLVAKPADVPLVAGNLVRGIRQYALAHLEALSSTSKLRKRLDGERDRGYAFSIRDLNVYLILLALEGRQDEIPTLATELMKPLKKQFADKERREIEEDINRLVSGLTTK